jgi:hypothetical protein
MVYNGDIAKLVTILNAEANDDFDTLKRELLNLQSEIGKMVVSLNKAQKKNALHMDNDEFDFGHDVKYTTEDRL